MLAAAQPLRAAIRQMARPLRIQYPGATYHVMSRGNAKQPIVSSNTDRWTFLEVLKSVVERYRWLCHAYCLMENHYHLLIETPEANLSRGMRQLNGLYTQRYNRHHCRVGHLFQGRFKGVLVQRDAHLLEVVRYIVLNPVEAGLVERVQDYRWSSYLATAGLSASPPWLTTAWVLAQFGSDEENARRAYRAFVAAPNGDALPSEPIGGLFRGDGSFVQAHRPNLERARSQLEIAKRERFADRPPLDALVHRGKNHSRNSRNDSIRRAHLDHGYALAEIAAAIGLHPSTISRIVNGTPPASNARFKT